MKTAKDLSRAQLEAIVTKAQREFWPRTKGQWSRDTQIDLLSAVQRIAKLMVKHGLAPEEI